MGASPAHSHRFRLGRGKTEAEMMAKHETTICCGWQGEGKPGSTHRVHHRIIHTADSDHGPRLHYGMIKRTMISRKMDMADRGVSQPNESVSKGESWREKFATPGWMEEITIFYDNSIWPRFCVQPTTFSQVTKARRK